MKGVKSSFALKTAALVVSFFTVAATLISTVAIGFMVYLDFYTRPQATLEESLVESFAYSELNNAFWHYAHTDTIDSYYKDKNIKIQIYDEQGTELYNSYNGEEYICTVSEKMTDTVYFTEDGEEFRENGVYSMTDTNGEKKTYTHYKDIPIVAQEDRKYSVSIYIPRNLEFTDRFFLIDSAVNLGYRLRYTLIFIAVISLPLSIFLIGYMFCSAGYIKGMVRPKLNTLDKIPIDLVTVLIGLFAFCEIWVLNQFGDWRAIVIVATLEFTVSYFLAMGYLLSIATRIKTNCLFKNTVIGRILSFIYKALKWIFAPLKRAIVGLPTVPKVAGIIAVVLAIELIATLNFYYELDNLIVFWIIKSIILAVAVLLAAIGFNRLKRGGERIALGDVGYKINTEHLYGGMKSFGESLNNIGDGLSAAVNDKMKSERLKTELITNVSHDIKTPLTSIINYVDLLKKEDIENEKANEYLEVLDRQSIRLKKLIEDLVEASKASTGNLPVCLTPCDMSVMLSQTVGEYDERLKSCGLQLVANLPKGVLVNADGRYLWRVLDNLMNNVCKYAQKGTRVYLDLDCVDNKARISLKNISNYPLNISGDELMGRFVRGDRSRNTEGSGLGLSIARSLVELQGGSMNIIVDGDLFKAEIIFDLIK